MVQVHGRRVSKRLHHLQSRVVFIVVVVVVVVVWRRARHFVGRRERERENGGTERRLKFRRSSNSLSLSFLCCCLLFTNERNVSLLLRVFLLKYFSVLCLCVRVTSLRPQACVILL